jgi:lipopolysaccharide/colanic/teichoic acid biosynthesis glycosyltransferase
MSRLASQPLESTVIHGMSEETDLISRESVPSPGWEQIRGSQVSSIVKRTLDITLAGPGLAILSPVIVVIALIIRITSPGPAFYRHVRMGKDGRPFTMYKFRSMYENQSDVLHRRAFERFRLGLPIAEEEGVHPYKLHCDPRITWFGSFLRRTSLDEMPQLWNILRGDMSVVGPRPPLPYEVEQYGPRHILRLTVLPGLTGLWQVSGRSRVTFEEMIDLDLEYIAHQSVLLDLRIILRTVPAVLLGRGAG